MSSASMFVLVVDCGVPPNLEKSVTYNSTVYEAKANYTCPAGQWFEKDVFLQEVLCVLDSSNPAFGIWQTPDNCTGMQIY
jgi:hypothetical protein